MGRKVYKMIDYIKKEPLFKNMFTYLVISLFLMWSILLISQYYLLEQVHREQIKLNQEVVGKLVSIYPERELEIVKTVINKDDENYLQTGNKTLLKYGYDINTKAFEDDIFKGTFYMFMACTMMGAFVITLLNIILFLRGSKYFGERLEYFSKNIDKVMAGDYSVNIISDTEGILSRISIRFEQMARRLKISFASLEKEKENIKSLITDISHQLKTPLASIKMFNSLLLEENIEECERIEFLNRSRADINKLEWLTGSLVKLSRLETGMINLKKEKGDVKETVCKAVNEVYLKASKKDIDISFESEESIFIIYDYKWTKEAIINVIENAIKYTKAGGYIKISLNKMESYIRLDIEDNGIGIDEEEVNNIFKRFYRGKARLIQNTEGSGVGLYLTRKILEEQGGCITVKSAKDAGTVFSLFLQNCYQR